MPAAPSLLSLRTVQRGAEAMAWPQRSVRLDADVYVVGVDAAAEAWPLEADTRPLVVELARPDGAPGAALEFMPTLRPIDGAVGRCLAEIGRRRAGSCRVRADAASAARLWAALVEEETALRARAARIACVKASTREALFRRLLLCADFIQSNFAEPLQVEALAGISHLSPFHFTRLFGLVMDRTPHAFVVQKRLAVARRWLAGGMTCGEAAVRAGFGCRSTLYRRLRDSAVARH